MRNGISFFELWALNGWICKLNDMRMLRDFDILALLLLY
jgi:hypothetical protein